MGFKTLPVVAAAIVAALWASLPSIAVAKEPRVVVGSKSFTESVILGEILTQLVNVAGADEVHREELGGTQILWKALLKGEIDIYPEYTGTLAQEILQDEPTRDEDAMRAALARRGVAMSHRVGFNNTYAIGMNEEHAERLQIRRISDLVAHPTLRFGLSDEFMERTDGWPGLKRRYKLPQSPTGLDHNLAYRGLEEGSLDVMDLYSTDAEIAYYKLRVLEDDRAYFPTYHAVVLWRSDLNERAPDVVKHLEKLPGQIDTKRMIELNNQVKLEHQTEERVAAEFLRSKMEIEVPLPGDDRQAAFRRATQRLATNTVQHLRLVCVSLLAAILVAVPLGIWADRQPRLGRLILSVTGIIQTIPSMALLVFLIPLLGLGARPAIVALFCYSLLPIVRNTYAGLQGIAPALRESADVLGLSSFARLRLVELPLASPSILTGIKTAAVINVGTATIGAFIGAGGYGQPILTGIRLDNLSLILQGAIPAAVLALLVEAGFSVAERWLIPQGLRIKN